MFGELRVPVLMNITSSSQTRNVISHCFFRPTNPCLISKMYDYSASQGTTASWNQFLEDMALVLLDFNGDLPSLKNIWEGVSMFESMFPVTDPFFLFSQDSPQDKFHFRQKLHQVALKSLQTNGRLLQLILQMKFVRKQ